MPGMPGWSNWYSNQYSTWNRTRRLSAAPYIATNENTNGGAATVIRNNTAQEAVIIDMGDLSDITNRDNKKQDTLFGPNIGVVTSGPAWTDASKKEKQPVVDQLTPDVVKGWIAKSKETSQPTTTLQALVNLKRPTLRLSPLSIAPNDDPAHKDSHDHHGLEFEYDCDAPKCGIYVHVLLSPSSDDHSKPASESAGLSRILVFETVVEGGFGKILKLEEGAMLELGRFEKQQVLHAEDPNPGVDQIPQGTSTSTTAPGPSDDSRRKSRRFSNFGFRKRVHREVAGPALAVVDAETSNSSSTPNNPTESGIGGGENKDKDGGKNDGVVGEDGVKVTIRLVALDGAGNPLVSPNEQGTYLHVVRMGAPAAGGGEGEEDSRPWVVKVVKREATIGPHTFHLHEIYGLSSQSSAPAAPLARTVPVPTPVPAPSAPPPPTQTEPHTYPPTQPPTLTPPTTTTTTTNNNNNDIRTEDDPTSSECLLCLSSPREVVLLPCRHLVACKECAMNMVEFGAGGNIVQPEAEVHVHGHGHGDAGGEAVGGEGGDGNGTGTGTGVGGGGEGGEAGGSNGEGAAGSSTAAPAVAAIPATTTTGLTNRRKRKAKGWFCPVCRQPYTSLLRITTSPPATKDGKDINRDSTSSDGLDSAQVSATTTTTTTTSTTSSAPRGALASLRPAFLRGTSRLNPLAEQTEPGVVPTLPRDVERGPEPGISEGDVH